MNTLDINKHVVKMLPLMFPFTWEREEWIDCFDDWDRVIPVFERNGFYYDRYTKIAWYEINGEAWKCRRNDDFIFQLEHIGDVRMYPKVFEAIKVLIQWNAESKKQRKAYMVEEHIRYINKLYTDTRTDMSKIIKDGSINES